MNHVSKIVGYNDVVKCFFVNGRTADRFLSRKEAEVGCHMLCFSISSFFDTSNLSKSFNDALVGPLHSRSIVLQKFGIIKKRIGYYATGNVASSASYSRGHYPRR